MYFLTKVTIQPVHVILWRFGEFLHRAGRQLKTKTFLSFLFRKGLVNYANDFCKACSRCLKKGLCPKILWFLWGFKLKSTIFKELMFYICTYICKLCFFTISHTKLFQFHMWNENFIYEINFHLWMFHFICEIHVSWTNISHVKFWTSWFYMWFMHFWCEKIPISYAENVAILCVFHMWNKPIHRVANYCAHFCVVYFRLNMPCNQLHLMAICTFCIESYDGSWVAMCFFKDTLKYIWTLINTTEDRKKLLF